MNGSEKEKARDMFHGLVIKFRPPQTKETMIHDIEKLNEILKTWNDEISNHRPDTLEQVINSNPAAKPRDIIPSHYTSGFFDQTFCLTAFAKNKSHE